MVKPERRTKGDILAAAAIVVVIVVATALIWWHSDARATISHPAAAPAPTIGVARAVPANLRQLWTAPSSRTDQPVIVGNVVVTGEGRDMVGRDPQTGEQRWSFARDRELCGVTWVYDLAVAVYPDSRGCGQVSTVNARTGTRGPTRTAYADKQITLSTDGITVLAAGPTRIEMWRSDMVRTLAYGNVDAPINPPVPPVPPCHFLSTAASSSGASILETCPTFPDVRLTLLKVAEEDVEPEQKYLQQPGVAADSGAKVLAVADLRTAVYLPTPRPRVVVYDEIGQEISSTELRTSAAANIPPPPSGPAGPPVTHVVVAGDTLWALAQRFYGDPFRYHLIAAANNIANPDLIHPGDVLLTPGDVLLIPGLPRPDPTPSPTVSRSSNLITVWTGDRVSVLDSTTLVFRYTIAPGSAVPLGPGAVMADRLLVPVTGGIAVYVPADGTFERMIPVDRGNVSGPVVPGVIGTTVIEQRGDTVVALGEAP